MKSISLAHCGESEDQASGGAQESRGTVLGELKAETTLPGVSKINIAKTFVTQSKNQQTKYKSFLHPNYSFK